jgi:TPR repeat protein
MHNCTTALEEQLLRYDADISRLLELKTRMEEQLLRHEAEISICLDLRWTIDQMGDRFSRLEKEVSRLGRFAKSEQLYRQGQEFIKTEDITKSCSLGLSLLRESADLGHGDAAFACGCYLEEGLICEVNEAESEHYFELSASLGNTSALATLGFHYGLGNRMLSRTDRPDALRNVKLSADRGNALGQYIYGCLLCKGIGIKADEAAGRLSLKLAADQRNPLGQFFHFMRLSNSRETRENPEVAVEYARDLAAKGNAFGQCIYGWAARGKQGVARNRDGGISFFKFSAEQRCPFGLAMYGNCLQSGKGIPRDPVLGEHYISVANSICWSHGFDFRFSE